MCLTLQKTKIQDVRVWSKKFIKTEEMGLSGASNPSKESPEFKLLLCQWKTEMGGARDY